MRCPKCGYISFDIVEKCVKCGKDISAAATELHGTVAHVPPPGFLTLDRPAGREKPEEMEAETKAEAAFETGGDEGVFVDLAGGDEAGQEEEGGFVDLGGEAAVQKTEMPVTAEEPEETAIDLADLAPVEEEAESGPEEFAFAFGDQKPTVSEAAGAEAGDAEAGGQGLEDLKVEGIDLDASPATSPGKDKVVPPVKTGTALDNFDVDLGDLFGKK